MANNNNDKLVIKLGSTTEDRYVPGADSQAEFEPLGKYDRGLVSGLSQEDIRAYNQGDFKAIANSFSQLITGTIGDLVATPGYIYDGMGSINGNSDEFDNWFISAGEFIKELGEDFAPIHMSQDSQETVFNPSNGS